MLATIMESEDDLGLSDVEADSEVEDTDAERELGVWLDQLNQFQEEDAGEVVTKRQTFHKVALTPKMAMDSFRHSILDIGSQDVDLDAILGELCELETQLTTQQSEINDSLRKTSTSDTQEEKDFNAIDSQFQSALSELSGMVGESLDQNFNSRECGPNSKQNHSKTINGNVYEKSKTAIVQPQRLLHDPSEADMEVNAAEYARFTTDIVQETLDCDSAFSETTSLPSSGSHISVTTTSSQNSGSSVGSSSGAVSSSPTPLGIPTRVSAAIQEHLDNYSKELKKKHLDPAEQANKLKAEKIRIALEKIKEANIKKLFVRAYTVDGSSKSILVDESMTVAQVCDMLVAKNHSQPSVHWAVLEQLPELYMERFLEDHDMVVDVMLLWPRDTSNKLMLVYRPDKYDVFIHPEKYFLTGPSDSNAKYDDASRKELIEECFQDGNSRIPDMEGMLYLKADGKKAWKKTFFVLRASGLYFNPKGKSKCSRDLQCLQKFEFVELYTGIGWKKKYKAPTDYGFALKHPQIQTKTSKFIRFLCTEDEQTMHQWMAGIRIAKIGYQLLTNYEDVCHRVANWDPSNVLPSRDLPVETKDDCDQSRPKSVEDCSRSNGREESGSETEEVIPAVVPAKMMPNLPVTTDVTKMLSEQYGMSRQSPQVTPKHRRIRSTASERDRLPPPPPNYEPVALVGQEFPPPPPLSAMELPQEFPESGAGRGRIKRAISDAQPLRGRITRRPSDSAIRGQLTRGLSEGDVIGTSYCSPQEPQPGMVVGVVTGTPQSPVHSSMAQPLAESSNMTSSYPPPPGSPQPAVAMPTHRRSGSAPPTPAKPKPPPPPKRSGGTKLTEGQQANGQGAGFLTDLQKVFHERQSRTSLEGPPGSPQKLPKPQPLPKPQRTSGGAVVSGDDTEELPPPPAELLEGLPPRTPKKKPPPPPRRSRETSLSQSRPTSDA